MRGMAASIPAPPALNGLKEKDLVLDEGRRLARVLQRPGITPCI